MINEWIETLKKSKIKTIIFPEGNEEMILNVALKLSSERILKPLLVVNSKSDIKSNDLDYIVIDELDLDEYAQKLYDFRNGKNELSWCKEQVNKSNYLATLFVKLGLADGLLGGLTYSTADTVRPALQIIKTRKESKIVSSSMLLIKNDEKLIFSDIAINVDPSSDELANITIDSVETAKRFGINPKVALLSFSTKGSAKHPMVDKVIETHKILEDNKVSFDFDGELQFDSAFVNDIGKKKAPGSKVAGNANIFIFPNLDSGNIGYKIASYMGDYLAVGPILQGLDAPINDLSRGSNEQEIFLMAVITALQVK